MKKPRDESRFGRGHDDGLEPLTPLDLLENDSVDALVRGMGRTAFGGRRLGEAADVLEAMVADEDCFRVVTVSGTPDIDHAANELFEKTGAGSESTQGPDVRQVSILYGVADFGRHTAWL